MMAEDESEQDGLVCLHLSRWWLNVTLLCSTRQTGEPCRISEGSHDGPVQKGVRILWDSCLRWWQKILFRVESPSSKCRTCRRWLSRVDWCFYICHCWCWQKTFFVFLELTSLVCLSHCVWVFFFLPFFYCLFPSGSNTGYIDNLNWQEGPLVYLKRDCDLAYLCPYIMRPHPPHTPFICRGSSSFLFFCTLLFLQHLYCENYIGIDLRSKCNCIECHRQYYSIPM